MMNMIMTENEEQLKLEEEDNKFQKYREEHKVILVGKEKGTYATLDEALEACDDFTSIYLEEGVYQIKHPITKAGLIIQKKDKEKDVFIIANEGPVCKIDL